MIATLREWNQKGYSACINKFLVAGRFAATRSQMDHVWQLPDLCRIKHFISHRVYRRLLDSIVNTPLNRCRRRP